MKNSGQIQDVLRLTAITACLLVNIGRPIDVPAQSQPGNDTPKFELAPFWPKPLPDHWVTGNVSGVCVDAQNHVFTVNRGNLVLYEQKTATPAPPITEFDPEGNLINSWGNRELLPAEEVHGCYVDYQNNI